MTSTTYAVDGMTCEHCERAVGLELRELPGVTDVQVSHATGQVVVTSDAPLDDNAVRTAIVEAGYELRTGA
jgi:copper chaperone